MTQLPLARNLVDGQWVDVEDIRIGVDPGDLDREVSRGGRAPEGVVAAACEAGVRARASWRALGPVQRGRRLADVADRLERTQSELRRAIVLETGKTLSEAGAEVARAVEHVRLAADLGHRQLGLVLGAEQPNTRVSATREPIGLVGAITPFNFPLAISAWKIAVAAAVGCTVVWKPSPITPWTSMLFADALRIMPPGVVNLVHGDAQAAIELIDNPALQAVTLTGSLEAGKAVKRRLGDRFVRTQLELGGRNALVVLADADVDAAAQALISGAFGQAGQRCSATSRAVVVKEVADLFETAVRSHLESLRVGHGLDPSTTMGALATEQQRTECTAYVEKRIAEGARLVASGRAPSTALRGWYLEPTVIDVTGLDDAEDREVFGPVVEIQVVSDPAHAVEAVGTTRFGMSCAVFTHDLRNVWMLRDAIDVGMFHVNRPTTGADSHLPHVGAKESQHGPAECGSFGAEFFTEWRSLCVSIN